MSSRMAGVLWMVMCCVVGCVDDVAPAPAVPVEESISLQMLRARPELKSQRFLNVLNFESPSDAIFLSGAESPTPIDGTRSHTGHSSARIDAGTSRVAVKLSSAMGPTPFPGEWTLAGAYFLSDRPARVTLSCAVEGAIVAREMTTLHPGRWTPAMIDLANPSKPIPSGQHDVMLIIEVDAPAAVWCDDVILIDNTFWALGGGESPLDFTVCRRGFNWTVDSRGRFNLQLPDVEVNPAGWKLEEASGLRVRLSSTGAEKSVVIYPNGRSFWDGRFRALTEAVRGDPLWAQQQSGAAQIQVPGPMGRLNRNSPGDQNNDGFNETRGAYTILARGPRLEVSIVPRTVPVLHPVLEVSGLPAGNVLVTIEGTLIEQSVRLPDGTFVVELPLRIERAVTVNLRVQ